MEKRTARQLLTRVCGHAGVRRTKDSDESGVFVNGSVDKYFAFMMCSCSRQETRDDEPQAVSGLTCPG